jgi:hypothetical protein
MRQAADRRRDPLRRNERDDDACEDEPGAADEELPPQAFRRFERLIVVDSCRDARGAQPGDRPNALKRALALVVDVDRCLDTLAAVLQECCGRRRDQRSVVASTPVESITDKSLPGGGRMAIPTPFHLRAIEHRRQRQPFTHGLHRVARSPSAVRSRARAHQESRASRARAPDLRRTRFYTSTGRQSASPLRNHRPSAAHSPAQPTRLTSMDSLQGEDGEQGLGPLLELNSCVMFCSRVQWPRSRCAARRYQD